MVNIETNPLYYATLGGVLLGIATSINYCLRGKVTGMSGMLYGLITCNADHISEKMGIIGGMLFISGIFFDIFGYESINGLTPFGPIQSISAKTSYLGFALGGLLVGFGSKLSNGCTSGHGLCGLPRLSIRSLIAVTMFLLAGMSIATINYYFTLGPFTDQSLNPQLAYNHLASANICIIVGFISPCVGGFIQSRVKQNQRQIPSIIIDQIITFIVGIVFGLGLMAAGMVRRVNILDFLSLGQDWNPSLMFVLGCGVVINLLSFNYMLKQKQAVLKLGAGHLMATNCLIPKIQEQIGSQLLVPFCFGLGWGLSGLCPGPAIMQMSVFSVQVHIIWMSFLIFGMLIARKIQHHKMEQKHANATVIKIQEEQKRKVSKQEKLSEKEQNQKGFDVIQVQNSLKDIEITKVSSSIINSDNLLMSTK